MNLKIALCVLLSVSVASGCVRQQLEAPDPDTIPVDLPWSYQAKTCLESDLLLLADQAALQAQLPEGFTAADASTIAGLPADVPTNRGVVFASAYVCTDTDVGQVVEGQIGILVESPEAAADMPDAFLNFYELLRYTTGEELRAFETAGWEVFDGNVSATMTDQSGTGAVVDQNATRIHSFEVTTPVGSEVEGIARFWHVGTRGLAVFEYELGPTEQRMGRATCTIAEGSPLATVAGTTTCTPQNAVGLGFPSIIPKTTLRLVGENATANATAAWR